MSVSIYNEIDPFAADWLTRLSLEGHIASGVVERRSIADLSPSDVAGPGQRHFFAGIGGWSYALRLAGWPDDVDVWTGSCPCQPFSSAGKKKGFDDKRHLWPDWFRLIRECMPTVVFGEQVASPDGRKWFAALRHDLESVGYAVGGADLCAAGIGAPHVRQRLYFVAYALRTGLEGLHETLRRINLQPVESLIWRNWETEPTVDRMANGLRAAGVGKLRGYGNAIVPQVAATFVRAALESL